MVLETKIVLILGVGGVGCLLLGVVVWYLMDQRQKMEGNLMRIRQVRTARVEAQLLAQQQQQPDFRLRTPDLRGVGTVFFCLSFSFLFFHYFATASGEDISSCCITLI